MFGARDDVDGLLHDLARTPATAIAGPEAFTKPRLDIQGIQPPPAFARSFECTHWLFVIGFRLRPYV